MLRSCSGAIYSVARRRIRACIPLKSEEIENPENEEMEKRELGITESWKPTRIDFSLQENQAFIHNFRENKYFTKQHAEVELHTKPEVRRGPIVKGEFLKGEYDGFGEHDLIDETYKPEWRNTYSARDRTYTRPNTTYVTESYDAHWDIYKRDYDELKKHMDMRWDEYVQEWGYTPVEYFESSAYKAKYKDDEFVWSTWVKNTPGRRREQQYPRAACFTPARTSTNACPIHRDYQLLVHYKNVPLLKQFTCPISGNIISGLRTGACLQANTELEFAIKVAYEYGYMLQPLPFYRPKGWNTRNKFDTMEEMGRNVSWNEYFPSTEAKDWQPADYIPQ